MTFFFNQKRVVDKIHRCKTLSKILKIIEVCVFQNMFYTEILRLIFRVRALKTECFELVVYFLGF